MSVSTRQVCGPATRPVRSRRARPLAVAAATAATLAVLALLERVMPLRARRPTAS